MFEVNATPDEISPEEELRVAILDSLGQSLSSKRADAIAARAASGIETEWQGDQEFYDGYDDANRDEFLRTAAKPTANGASGEAPKRKAKGSVVFPNITQPYVDAAAARVGDMLLPTDDRNFALEATPIPEMGDLLDKLEGAAEQEPIQTAPMALPGVAALPPQVVSPVAQAIAKLKAAKAEAARKAERAQSRIDDWLIECQYHAELRRVIDDCAKLGSGVVKGPVPVNRKASKWERDESGEFTLTVIEEIKPASFRVDPWNLFPDGACGESIHDGAYIWERDYLTGKKLAELKGLPGYIDSQIDRCIEEGAKTASASKEQNYQNEALKREQFEIWYFHGSIKAEEMEAAGCVCEGNREYPAMITMVNNRVIRASLNPVSTGDFPYDVIPWKRRPGIPWGMGVGRQIRTPQRMVVGATRQLMNNLGLSSGPQITIRRGVEPEDGNWTIEPLKIWVEGDESGDQAGPPVIATVIPSLQDELMKTIQLGMKMAEDVTGLPQIMQGQQGSAPETVGGMTILNNNANSVLRRIARLFDSQITEPHIRRYYAWLMEYGEDPEEKGDFQIVARGSSALVERDIQGQEMIGILQLSVNPIFGKSPAKAMDEYLKSRRFDPATFDYTDEEKEKMAQQQQPPPPQVMVAQVREKGATERTQMEIQSEERIAAMENQTDQARIAKDVDRDTVYVQAEMDRTVREHQSRMAELNVRLELAREAAKVKLADSSMKLQTQMNLAMRTAPQALTPPTEPPGQAPDGQSFQR